MRKQSEGGQHAAAQDQRASVMRLLLTTPLYAREKITVYRRKATNRLDAFVFARYQVTEAWTVMQTELSTIH
jgi:hypothetical protein